MRGLIVFVLYYAYRIADLALWAYVLMSWFVRPGSQLWRFYCKLAGVIEPFLGPIRGLLSNITYRIGLDFSPLLLMLLLNMFYRAVVSMLYVF